MRIAHIEIQNFRKLKSCRIDLGERETIFVGANNTGKTSAIDALILFLKKDRRREIDITDFTLSNWNELNKIGEEWIEKRSDEEEQNLEINQWRPYLPSIDLWLEVEDSELHLVHELFPSLSWDGGLLGVRLSFEPKLNKEQQVEDLYKEFIEAYSKANALSEDDTNGSDLDLWPQSLKDFLDGKLQTFFEVNSYLLDPDEFIEPTDGIANPQDVPEGARPLNSEPFEDLININDINAQRGFADPKSKISSSSDLSRLSVQLRNYYEKHLDPSDLPGKEDIDALRAIDEARKSFDSRLEEKFKSPIDELETIGYPGLSDPQITIKSEVNPIDSLDHDSAVQFSILEGNDGQQELTLPEKYNGLGYQNLISMVFKLIRFRDEWMREGKVEKTSEDSIIEPLHLVLLEEPEAHLHAQVQKVFIDKAYEVLRNHERLNKDSEYSTQLVVSTHSNHVAHEVDFSNLRYFRKEKPSESNSVPVASIINLTDTFGNEPETARFATRYLKATHSNLFFADAVILVEGTSERLLIPYFIKENFSVLDSLYISILEIGGSHAHRLKPLIEKLGLLTLIITDLDSAKKKSNNRLEKAAPERGANQKTKNNTLKEWLPCKENIDELLDCDNLLSSDNQTRVAFQQPIKVKDNNSGEIEFLPYTFEDALAISNNELFGNLEGATGLIKKMQDALNDNSIEEVSTEMFEALNSSSKKATMAMDLLFLEDPGLKALQPPEYIENGLAWLQSQLKDEESDLLIKTEGGQNGS
ncbi:ATP-dependent nuclease [Fodinibius halophilus]|uniref:AAA family ATPase n=1 Tax=Fodinibius halophilus TaxID=1736908 RepID=A0A6M1T4S6_9BACT|nr:AAA family ATPase [Fodinibius halophilus]NGP89047.1 AAA family ATPase [Fodinibius halophilus]